MSDTPTTPNELTELVFYLPHYFDKAQGKFVPYLYAGMAQSVFLDADNEDNVADALKQLQDAKVYTLSELFAHISNTNIHVSGGEILEALATINELIIHADNNGIHVLPSDKTAWSGGVAVAEEARTIAAQAGAKVIDYENRIARLEDGLFNDITGNPFLISFDNLAGLTLVKGVWNKEGQRVEC